MIRSIALITMALIFIAITSKIFSAVPEEDIPNTLIKVPVSGPDDVEKLIKAGLSIELNIIRNGIAEGLISQKNLEKIRNTGFKITVVDNNIKETIYKLYENTGSSSVSSRKDKYYTYEDVKKLLNEWHEKYPAITNPVEIPGKSIDGKDIFLLRISGTLDTAARQRIVLTGSTHGNEIIGTECVMRIADYFLSGYESDQEIKEIVNRSEIIIIPIVNADGFPNRRTLSSGKDPNRAFGYHVGDMTQSFPYEWPEMQIYRDLLIESPWYVSFDYHSGLVGLLDPFFCPGISSTLDDAAYSRLNDLYGLNYNNTDQIFRQGAGGVACDGAYGKCGTMAVLPEVCGSKPPASGIEQITDKNLDSVLKCIIDMQKGVYGRVKCSHTKAPLYARIQVANNGAAVFTSPKSGAFFKYIPSTSGSFEVTAFANAYEPMTKTVDAVSDGFAEVDFELVYSPEQPYAALSVDAIRTSNSMSLSDVYACLELHDDKGITMEGSGSKKAFVNLDMGPTTPITDHEGDDITIYATNSENYTVRAANILNEIEDDSHILGDGQGEKSFDLSSIGLDSARFIQISCTNGKPSIDAVEAVPIMNFVDTKDLFANSLPEKIANPKILYSSGTNRVAILQAYIHQGVFKISIYDLKGKEISTLKQGNAKSSGFKSFLLDNSNLSGSQCASGTYLFCIQTVKGNSIVKTPIIW